MKSKKHDLAWLTGRISVDLQDATEKLIDIALSRIQDRELMREITAVVDDLEGLKGIIYNAVAAPNFKAAAEESATNAANKRDSIAERVNKEALKESLARYRASRLPAYQRGAIDITKGWKKWVALELESSYPKVIEPRLKEWGMSAAQINRYVKTGEW